MLIAALQAFYMSSGLYRTRVGRTYRRLKSMRSVPQVNMPTPNVHSNSADGPDVGEVLVAFQITGGIGDHLIAARYIRDLIAATGRFRFDVYSSRSQILDWAFSGIPGFNRGYSEHFAWRGKQYYKYYPLAMRVAYWVGIEHDYANWNRLHLTHPKLARVCEYIDRSRHDYGLNPLIDGHPWLDSQFGAKAVFMNLDRYRFTHAMSQIAYGGHRLELRQDGGLRAALRLNHRPYLTVHNGFDAEFLTSYAATSRSTKRYPHFDEVIRMVHQRHPGLVIVQLGTTTSKPIQGVDHQLIGKTTMEETTALLAGATLHLDNESGLVHLAACLGTTSCVVFGPTPAAYFGYEDNLNITPRECGGCWWSTKTWMMDCPRGFEQPVCVWKTPPEAVADAVSKHLENRLHPIRLSTPDVQGQAA